MLARRPATPWQLSRPSPGVLPGTLWLAARRIHRRGRGWVIAVADTVRWGIIGTANIARSYFLPAVGEAGGKVIAVAGRDANRTSQWALDNGIPRSVVGYQQLVEDPGVDALY